MANSAKITLNDTTPTLIFSGVGNVFVQLVSGNYPCLGGSSVSTSNGFRLITSASSPFHMSVNSPDEIWGISPSGNSIVEVLEVR